MPEIGYILEGTKTKYEYITEVKWECGHDRLCRLGQIVVS
jgi:hypothetical protein